MTKVDLDYEYDWLHRQKSNTHATKSLANWLEKAGKKAWHTDDGKYPSHPVAVKHHEEYFAEQGKVAEVEKHPIEDGKEKKEPTDQDIIADILKNPNVVNIDQWQKEYEIIDKQQRGSTEGFKVLHKPSGNEYYVKFPTLARVGIEDLANRLYRLAGVPVAFSSVMSTDNGFGIGSKWLPNAQKVPTNSDEAIKTFVKAKPEILNNFVIDTWLANWDAVGMDYDNLVYSNGKVYHIDQGGSLMLRAQGEVKPFGDKVPELESMRDPEKAPQASRFFKHIEDKHLKAGASKLASITDEQIKEIVSGLIGHEEIEKEKIANTLIKRRDYIVDKILTPKERERKPCSPGLHRHKEYEACHPIDRRHRGQAGFGSSFAGIDKVMSRVKDKEIRALWQKAKDIPQTELIYAMDSNNPTKKLAVLFGLDEQSITMYAESPIQHWQSGTFSQMATIRGAINYLKNQAEEKYAQEQAYFVFERGDSPQGFDFNYKSGIRDAKYFIPIIAATQAYLKEMYPSGFVTLYRGIMGAAGIKLRDAYQQMNETDTIAIPHSGLSSFSSSQAEAQVFAGPGIPLLSKQMPISSVWIVPSWLTNRYHNEREYLVDGDAVQLFTMDELIPT